MFHGSQFLEWIKRQGITQSELADRMGLRVQYVWRLLHGKQRMNDAFVGRFARVFGPEALVEVWRIDPGGHGAGS